MIHLLYVNYCKMHIQALQRGTVSFKYTKLCKKINGMQRNEVRVREGWGILCRKRLESAIEEKSKSLLGALHV